MHACHDDTVVCHQYPVAGSLTSVVTGEFTGLLSAGRGLITLVEYNIIMSFMAPYAYNTLLSFPRLLVEALHPQEMW